MSQAIAGEEAGHAWTFGSFAYAATVVAQLVLELSRRNLGMVPAASVFEDRREAHGVAVELVA
jgi:hypothetical protein